MTTCDRRPERSGPGPVPIQGRTGLREVVELSREEVFEVCGRLALAHRSLVRAGDVGAASELALVFALMEGRLVA